MRNVFIAIAIVLGSASSVVHANEQEDAADRIRSDGERAGNRGDVERQREANRAADRAETSCPAGARQTERDYNKGVCNAS
jgi:hypothetical protein